MNRKMYASAAAALVLLAGTVAVGQGPIGTAITHQGQSKESGAPINVFTPNDAVLSPQTLSTMAHLRELYPQVQFYVSAARVTRVYGTQLNAGATPEAAAEEFVRAHAVVFGADAADLVPGNHFNTLRTQPVLYEPASGTYRFTLVYYAEHRGGVPVYQAELRVLVLNKEPYSVVWAGSSLRELGDLSVPAGLATADPGDRGHAAALKLVPGLVWFTAGRYVIWAGVDDQDAAPVLAVQFAAADSVDDHSVTQHWRFIADAATGEILYRESRICLDTVTGRVYCRRTTDYSADYCGGTTLSYMPYAEVWFNRFVPGQWVYADLYGYYECLYLGHPLWSLVSGDRFQVSDYQGDNEDLTAVPQNGHAYFTHNDADNDERIRAESNGYWWAHFARNFVLAQNPNYPDVSTQTTFDINVNRAPGDDGCPCNAWYDPGIITPSINFCRSVANWQHDPNDWLHNCANSAFGGVILHEYGHRVVEMGGSGQGQYGEGLGDCMNVLNADDPGVAYGLTNNFCAPLRTANNTLQYPCTDPNDGGHYCAQLLSGCVWSTRNALVLYGWTNYREVLANLTINSVLLHDGSRITPQIAVDFLTLDDDDGYLFNGTPHGSCICMGFGAHNMGCPFYGACCYDNGRCDVLIEADCEPWGHFQGAGTGCLPNPCPQAAACCFASGECAMETQTACTSSGGIYHGAGTDCSPNPCPQPGACCYTNGNCIMQFPPDCLSGGGVFHGIGAACTPNPCPQPGACCYSDGHCEVTLQAACTGTWHGANTTCVPSPCPGACCFDDGQCEIQPEGPCWVMGGHFKGVGTACSPSPCPTTGACCFPEGQCLVLTKPACAAYGGTPHMNSPCAPNPCPQPGACCFADGHCEIHLPADCSGDYLGAGTTCGTNTCQGACCHWDGVCSEVLEPNCLAPDNTFQGAGTTCTSHPCGACCFADGHCEVQQQANCPGLWLGVGTNCFNSACPQPGACCYLDGHCALSTVTAPGNCGAGGTYLGDNTTCGHFTCPQPGACCFGDGHCEMSTVTAPGDCATGGLYDGDGSFCATGTCPQPGACCYADGHCAMSTALAPGNCGSGGLYIGDGTTCAMVGCPQPGACCSPEGYCEMSHVTAPGDCPPGSAYLGDYVGCANCPLPGACCFPEGYCEMSHVIAPGDCPPGSAYLGDYVGCANCPAPGACCFADGHCEMSTVMYPGDCATGGQYLGDNTFCPQCPQPGACCFADGHCEMSTVVAPGNCAAGGTYMGDGTECTLSFCAHGACCVGWDCSIRSPADCAALHGRYQGDNTTCDPNNPCPTPAIVVCEPQGVPPRPYHPPHYWYLVTPGSLPLTDFHVRVYDSNPANYTNVIKPPNWLFVVHAVGSEWWASWYAAPLQGSPIQTQTAFAFDNPGPHAWGAWVTTIARSADPNAPQSDNSAHHAGQPDGYGYRVHVPQPNTLPGACCFPDGHCEMLTQAGCTGQGGTWKGDLTDCASIQCPVTIGACCIGSSCSIQTEAECLAAGGRYRGAGTACTPAACVCPGDTNCDGRVTFADIDPFVEALSGESAWNQHHPGCPWLNADCNNSGTVTFADIDPFVALLGTTCP